MMARDLSRRQCARQKAAYLPSRSLIFFVMLVAPVRHETIKLYRLQLQLNKDIDIGITLYFRINSYNLQVENETEYSHNNWSRMLVNV